MPLGVESVWLCLATVALCVKIVCLEMVHQSVHGSHQRVEPLHGVSKCGGFCARIDCGHGT